MKNNYEVRGDVTAIFLNSSKYGSMETLISTQKLGKAISFLGKWYPRWSKSTKTFYVQGNTPTNKKTKSIVSLHRWLSDSKDGCVVDHFDHETLNNTDDNLRIIPHSDNCQNKNGARKDSSSGVRGVYWIKKKKRWLAYCVVFGKKKCLGNFIDIKDAELAAIEGRKKYLPYANEPLARCDYGS